MEFALTILVIISLSIFHSTAQLIPLPPLLGDPCDKADCGKGKCVHSSASLLGFDCVCDSGWTKMPLGPINSSCILPNCLSSFQCGNGAPLLPPPSFPPLNFSSPCNLVWCGDGKCVASGTDHYCQCNAGSDNIFNATALPCFNECYLQLDCNGVKLGQDSPPPPENGEGNYQNHNSPPPNSQGNGSNNAAKTSWSNGAIMATYMLITIFKLFWDM